MGCMTGFTSSAPRRPRLLDHRDWNAAQPRRGAGIQHMGFAFMPQRMRIGWSSRSRVKYRSRVLPPSDEQGEPELRLVEEEGS